MKLPTGLRRGLTRGCPAALAATLLALPGSAASLPLPSTFPRDIVITGTDQGIRVSRFEVAARPVGANVRVTVRVAAVALAGAHGLLIAVGPCTSGPVTSPLCRPRASARMRLSRTTIQATRSFLVARPAAAADALRVTLTRAGRPVPFERSRVGGGGGTAEILLNGGTWRFAPGTWWGLVALPPAGVALEGVWFNSRRYEWRATSRSGGVVATAIGYELEPPRWLFTNTLRAGVPFSFHRTPSTPAQSPRRQPRVLSFAADIAGERLFSVRVPLPAWRGR